MVVELTLAAAGVIDLLWLWLWLWLWDNRVLRKGISIRVLEEEIVRALLESKVWLDWSYKGLEELEGPESGRLQQA